MVHIRLPRLSDSRAWKIDNRAYDYHNHNRGNRHRTCDYHLANSHEYRSYAIVTLRIFSDDYR